MEMKPVTSSQIHAVGYDPESKKMRIQFHARAKDAEGKWQTSPGTIYEYEPIEPDAHAAFIGAESVGKHFGANIKGHPALTYRKIVEE